MQLTQQYLVVGIIKHGVMIARLIHVLLLDTCLAAFLQLTEHEFGISGFLIRSSV